MEELLDAIVELLSFFLDTRQSPTPSSEYSSFINSCQLPAVNQSSIDSVRELYKESSDLMASIIPFKPIFAYNKPQIEKILSFKIKDPDKIPQFLRIIYANAMGFLLSDMDDDYILNLENIITLFHIHLSDNGLAYKIYLYILYTALNKSSAPFPDELVQNICAHICFSSYSLQIVPEIGFMLLRRVSETTNNVRNILNMIDKVIKQLDIEYDKTNFFTFCQQKVFELIPDYIMYMNQIASYYPESKIIKDTYSNLPSYIIAYLKEHAFEIQLAPSVEHLFAHFVRKHCDETCDESLIPNIDDWRKTLMITESKEFKSFIPDEIMYFLLIIAILFHGKIDNSFITLFFDSFSSLLKTDSPCLILIPFIFLLASSPMTYQISQSVLEKLINRNIFKESVTMFERIPNYETTSFFRSKVLLIFFKHGHKLINQFFNQLLEFPFLFSDMLFRVNSFFNSVELTTIYNKDFINTVFQNELNLRNVYGQVSGKYKEQVLASRSVIYHFILRLLEVRSLPHDTFNMQDYSNDFLKIINFPSFKIPLFSTIQKNLIMHQADRFMNNIGCRIIGNILTILKYSRQREILIQIHNELLKYIIDSLIEYKNIGASCASLLDQFFAFHDQYPSNDFFINLLYFISELPVNVISDQVLKRLPPLLAKYYKSTKLTQYLYKILGTEELIINTKMLFVLMSSLKPAEYFQKIEDYCKVSNYNRFQLHEGEFDLLLIEMMVHYPNPFDFRGYHFNSIEQSDLKIVFRLFLMIFSTKSSMIVSNQIIQFLCSSSPIKSDFLEAMRPIEVKFADYRTVCMPLGFPKEYFSFSLPFDDFINDSSVRFVALLDSVIAPQLNITISVFEILLGPRLSITILFKGIIFAITFSQNETVSTIEINHELLLSRWNTFNIYFKKENQSLNIKIVINKTATFFVDFPFNKVKAQEILFSVGNLRSFDLDKQKLLSAYHFCAFEFTPANANFPTYTFTDSHKSLNSTISHPHQVINSNMPNLLQVFSSFYPVESILPVFIKFDQADSVQIFDAISNFFYGKISKISSIIAFLVKEHPENINFDLYQHFFSVLAYPDTDHENIFNDLIFNFDIWLQASSEDICKIIEHWDKIMFEVCINILMKDSFMTLILHFIRKYFYFNPVERYIISPIQRNLSHEELLICRSHLDSIIIKRCHKPNGFNENDAEVLLSTMVKCYDVEQIRHLFKLFSLFKIEGFSLTQNHIRLMNSIDYQKTPEFAIEIIKCLYSCSNDSFFFNLTLMSNIIPENFPYILIIDKLVDIPELFTLAIIVGIRSPDEVQYIIASQLFQLSTNTEAISKIKNCENWMIWPLLFTFNLIPPYLTEVSLFIAKVITYNFQPSDLDTFVSLIILFDMTTEFEVYNTASTIMKFVIDDEEIIKKHSERLIKASFQILFTRGFVDSHSYNLMTMFSASVFNDFQYEIERKATSIKNNSDLERILNIRKIKFIVNLVLRNPNEFSQSENALRQSLWAMFEERKKTKQIDSYLVTYIKWMVYYPQIGKEKQQEILYFLSYNVHGWLSDMIDSMQKHITKTSSSLMESFEKQTDAMNEIIITKGKTSDPAKEIKVDDNQMQLKWRSIIQKYTRPRSIWPDEFTWRRDFSYSPNFQSFKLKRVTTIPKAQTNQIRFPQPTAKNVFLCELIKIEKKMLCRFSVLKNNFVLEKQVVIKEINADQILHIFIRNRKQKQTAIEFYLTNGRSYLLDFKPVLATKVINSFKGMTFPNIIYYEKQTHRDFVKFTHLLDKWRSREISNYQFILQLNLFTGRSFKDPENYLLFPWLFIDEKQKLRNLDFPIVAQSREKIDHYTHDTDQNGFMTAPSNVMLLTYYFVRLSPYTELHIKIHDNKFDVKERMFRTFNSFLTNLITDHESKESTPEFFNFPEAFLDLSQRSGAGDLVVPSSFSSIFEFIYLNRKLLESKEITENIGKWIDLIWGFSQRGEEAKKRVNIYYHCLYEDIWSIAEEKEETVEYILSSLGSIPPCVFKGRIPPRDPDFVGHRAASSIWRQNKFSETSICEIRFDAKSIHRSFFSMKGDDLVLFAITSEGDILKYIINLQYGRMENAYSFQMKAHPSSQFYYDNEILYVFDNNSNCVNALSQGQTLEMKVDMPAIDFIGGGLFNIIITCTRTGSIYQWDINDLSVSTYLMSVFSDTLKTVSISQEFDVLVYTTANQYLEIYSLSNERIVNSVYLEDELSYKIMITQSFGYILVVTDRSLWLFTINGFLIKKIENSIGVDALSTWKDKNDIDFICFSDVNGKIFVFEAFYPEKLIHLTSCHQKIASISYVQELHSIVAITTEASLLTIPY